MLDKDVPNSSTQNPKFNTHKVFAAIGIILVVIITILSGLWYLMENTSQPAVTKTTEKVKVSTNSAHSASAASASAYITKDDISSVMAEQPAEDTNTPTTTDTTNKPTCSFFSPADASTVSGTVKIIVSLAANAGYTDWNVTLNGTPILGNAINSTYLGYNWDTTKETDGSFTMVCNITDSTGVKGSSTQTVTVKNN